MAVQRVSIKLVFLIFLPFIGMKSSSFIRVLCDGREKPVIFLRGRKLSENQALDLFLQELNRNQDESSIQDSFAPPVPGDFDWSSVQSRGEINQPESIRQIRERLDAIEKIERMKLQGLKQNTHSNDHKSSFTQPETHVYSLGEYSLGENNYFKNLRTLSEAHHISNGNSTFAEFMYGDSSLENFVKVMEEGGVDLESFSNHLEVLIKNKSTREFITPILFDPRLTLFLLVDLAKILDEISKAGELKLNGLDLTKTTLEDVKEFFEIGKDKRNGKITKVENDNEINERNKVYHNGKTKRDHTGYQELGIDLEKLANVSSISGLRRTLKNPRIGFVDALDFKRAKDGIERNKLDFKEVSVEFLTSDLDKAMAMGNKLGLDYDTTQNVYRLLHLANKS